MNVLYKPENLDLQELLTKDEYKQHNKGISALVHVLMCHSLRASDYKHHKLGCVGGEFGGWVRLHRNKLIKILTSKKYGATLQLAKDKGIIEVLQNKKNPDKKYYSKGKFPMAYRMCRPYYGKAIVEYDVNPKLVAKVKAAFAFDPSHLSELHKALYDYILKFDMIIPPKVYAALPIEQRYAVDALINKDIYLITCQNGRVYTPFTGLKKTHRQYIYYNGEQITGDDISNSQPLLAYHLMNTYTKKITSPLTDPSIHYLPNGQPRTQPPTHTQQPSPYISSLYEYDTPSKQETLGITNRSFQAEIDEGLAEAQAGTFYKYFGKLLNIPPEEAKITVLKTIFDDWFGHHCPECDELLHRKCSYCSCGHRFKKRGKGKDIHPFTINEELLTNFKSKLPGVYQFIYNYKIDDYKQLSASLTKKESVLMSNIAGRMVKEHPDKPILTCHDCFFITKGNYHILHRIIMEEYAKIGLIPTTHEEL